MMVVMISSLTFEIQGAGAATLLTKMDAVKVVHEGMAPAAYNDDITYKTWTNEVAALSAPIHPS
jgi:hypothetical protein